MFWQPSEEKHSLKFDDFGACCSQESFVWVTLNVFLWPSQELAKKKKKHWLWMMDGQHLFYSWKWKKDHNAFTCTMTQTLTTMDSYFSFEWTLDSRPEPRPHGLLQCIIILLNFPYYPKKKYGEKETLIFLENRTLRVA